MYDNISAYVSCKRRGTTIKHSNKEQLKKLRRRKLRIILFIEFILVVAALYGIYRLSCYNVLMREAMNTSEIITSFDSKVLEEIGAESLKVTRERIVEEVDEYLWTAEETSYRKGPDESYDEAGTLENEKMVKRTGMTKNEWSRIIIDDEEYYVMSSKLTNETPISALLWSGEKGEYQKYALSLFPDFGWSDRELEPLINLWNKESRWNPNAHNRSSGAHGIPQSLPASKMASEGSDYYTNANTQIRWGLKYIARRYGSPSAAWSYFLSHNSY